MIVDSRRLGLPHHAAVLRDRLGRGERGGRLPLLRPLTYLIKQQELPCDRDPAEDLKAHDDDVKRRHDAKVLVGRFAGEGVEGHVKLQVREFSSEAERGEGRGRRSDAHTWVPAWPVFAASNQLKGFPPFSLL